VIAETRVDAVDGKGHKKQFRFVIEAPTQLDNESWGCVLTMKVLQLAFPELDVCALTCAL
jgi:hypothetical protein